jgi:hypothetical protein
MGEIDPMPRRLGAAAALDDAALVRIAGALADSYGALYQEPAVDPRASLTGDMLAFSFQDGLNLADKALLRGGHVDRLEEFRRHFFEVVGDELSAVVVDLAGVPVDYSFYGFDPGRRTTHGVFILDLGSARGAEGRQAVLNWSEQVRRSAGRLRAQHREIEAYYAPLKAEWKRKREELTRREPSGRSRERSDER